MPDHRGQTYDPQQEPAPRGGWFRLEERPYPERVDRVSRWLSGGLGAAITTAGVGAGAYAWFETGEVQAFGLLTLAAIVAAAMAYGFTRGIGMIIVGLYGTARDGSEFVVDWRAIRHDLPLRRTWIVVLEGALLLAAGCTSLWGLLRFVKQGEGFGLVVFILIQAMTYWPLIRRRIAAGRTRG